ncbi:MAG: hypothetical protein M3P29_00585 [Acidobacteriota bacterium]|nr:hypothetical protein [Acidobacteriota bacterium]
MRRSIVFFLALALALAACAKQDDAEKLAKAIVSWSSTLQLVADARLGNDVRVGYAVKTVDAAIEDLSSQAAAPSLPKSLTSRAERLIGIGGNLRRALESDDRAGIARARRELAAEPAGSK